MSCCARNSASKKLWRRIYKSNDDRNSYTYKKIKLKKQKVSVTAAEVTSALDDIQTRFTQFEEAKTKASKPKMGDRVTIDTDGYEDGKLLETTSMRDYPLVLGSGLLVPGFEEGLV